MTTTMTRPARPARTGMVRVLQRGSQDCGIAVLAMLTGESYEEVRDNLLNDSWMRYSEFVRAGGESDLPQPQVEKYLTDRGYFLSRVYSRQMFPNPASPGQPTKDITWPPQPFAPKHFAIVANPQGGHYVAIDEQGFVHDPLPNEPGAKSLTDWRVVNVVVGLVHYIHDPENFSSIYLGESSPRNILEPTLVER